MTHTMIVTRVPDDESDDVEYEIEGPHDSTCETWMPCEIQVTRITVWAGWWPVPGHPRPSRARMGRSRSGRCTHEATDDDEGEGEYTAHGELHKQIDDRWMVLTDDCAAIVSDAARSDLWQIAEDHGLGRHEVEIDYYGDGDWSASYVAPTEN